MSKSQKERPVFKPRMNFSLATKKYEDGMFVAHCNHPNCDCKGKPRRSDRHFEKDKEALKKLSCEGMPACEFCKKRKFLCQSDWNTSLVDTKPVWLTNFQSDWQILNYIEINQLFYI